MLQHSLKRDMSSKDSGCGSHHLRISSCRDCDFLDTHPAAGLFEKAIQHAHGRNTHIRQAECARRLTSTSHSAKCVRHLQAQAQSKRPSATTSSDANAPGQNAQKVGGQGSQAPLTSQKPGSRQSESTRYSKSWRVTTEKDEPLRMIRLSEW